MLELYYESERTIWRLNHCGPFGAHMEGFAQYLSQRYTSRNVVREYIRGAAHFSRYALREGVYEAKRLDSALAYRFINEHLPTCSCERMNSGVYASTTTSAQHVLDYLAGEGYFAPPSSRVGRAPASQHFISRRTSRPGTAEKQATILAFLPETIGGLVLRYDEYLDRLFGLCQKTRDIHRAKTLLFLKWVYENHGADFELSALTAPDIIAFQEMCNETGYSHDYRKTVTGCLRGFLRFLRWERILTDDLTPAVYKVIEWRLASVPKHIPYEDAMLLVSAADRNMLKGKRDYLMLLLMLQLGLRANEIIQMQLGDISLQKGELFIRNTKTNRDRVLPLTNDLADAMVDYLRHRISETPQQRLFLRSVPPHTPLASSAALGSVVRRYIEETGMQTPTLGTHQLRHALATRLVNHGVSFKETADILGHRSIQSTGTYAKVQIERLKEIALPFPCWEEVCSK